MIKKMKYSAVEYLEKIYLNEGKLNELDFSVAKEMQKEHIINSFVEGADFGEMFKNENRVYLSDAENYYKETFKKK
jgi:hypothetical protein